jgi:hypothetical protein
MSDRSSIVQRIAAGCVAVLLFGVAPSVVMAADASVTELADAIRSRFKEGGYSQGGQLGTDWCFNVQTEPGYTWWYFAIPDDQGKSTLKPTKVRSTVRIQAIYVDPNDGKTKYSSLLMGVQLPDDAPYQALDLDSPLAINKDPNGAKLAAILGQPASARLASNDGLREPPTTLCMTFAQFLNAYALNVVAVRPVTFMPGDLAKAGKDKESEDYNTGARYWVFAGRSHAVVAIASYVVSFQYTESSGNTKKITGQLIVGFGGGAGP